MTSTRSLLWLLGLLAVPACAATPAESDPAVPLDEESENEAWNYANNPSYVDGTFVYEVDKLPISGKTKSPPIPADYWATYKDSINVRWDGDQSLSPAEKWEKAFGRAGTAKAVSEEYGIRAYTSRKECANDGDCSSLTDGSSCAIPRGETKGRCIPTWWGICHGWSPYAISEPAAQKPVTKNGVTFYPGDLEGLMSLLYSVDLPTKFLSQRCNQDKPTIAPDGRVESSECRDMNPGSFHVVATNFLGLRQQGFVYDRTAFSEVWNQPVRGYQITNAVDGKLKEITKAEAVALLGVGFEFKEAMPKTTLKKGDKKTGELTATADGEVVVRLGGTGDADLYVKKGDGASESAFDCRDADGDSNEECKVTLKSGEKLSWMVAGYGDSSDVKLEIGARKAGEPTYTPNPAAKRFFHVMMDFQYIREARPAQESHVSQVDMYTSTDDYEYLLEADDKGAIVGGEWLGASRSAHPDFAWWPSGKPGASVARGLITYAEAKALNDEAAGTAVQEETKELLRDVTVKSYSAYATVGVPAGAKLTVTMTGSGGNADLYVRLGKKPTIYAFDCKSTGSGTSESCTVTAPASGGTYYVRARPVGGTSKVTVVAKIAR